MKELEDYINRINDKIQQLSKVQNLLQKQNEKLKRELFNITSREKEKDAYVELLSMRIEVLKASKGDMNEEDKKSFEKKINLYLREIEKCIRSLNE